MSDNFPKVIFFTSIVLLSTCAAFLFGVTVERIKFWPYEIVNSARLGAVSIAKFGELVPPGRRVVAAKDASRERFTIYKPEQIADGYYIFVGWSDQVSNYAAWLYDGNGKLLHIWPIDYLSFDPDGPLNNADSPHPFAAIEDGSIIVGFDKGDVMVRLDSCGEPIWIKNGIYHHAISRADGRNYWVWRGDGGSAYGHFNYMEKFNADTGETLRVIGLIEDVIRPAQSSALIFGVTHDFPFQKLNRDPNNISSWDIFHPNDVEVLSIELAPMFEMFEAGDLLISLRTTNLVAVIDGNDYRIKWWSHGPWIGQHDPDFTVDGKISVFNNNTWRGDSAILKIDPHTKDVANNLHNGDVTFRTNYMGTHQYLPSGNVLIVSPGEGRVLEVTASGTLVMEFNNVYPKSKKYNDHVENGVWLPADYFPTIPVCSE